jgi:hypothetical protein
MGITAETRLSVSRTSPNGQACDCRAGDRQRRPGATQVQVMVSVHTGSWTAGRMALCPTVSMRTRRKQWNLMRSSNQSHRFTRALGRRVERLVRQRTGGLVRKLLSYRARFC